MEWELEVEGEEVGMHRGRRSSLPDPSQRVGPLPLPGSSPRNAKRGPKTLTHLATPADRRSMNHESFNQIHSRMLG